MNPLSPKKLLLTKWTASQPTNREKHFVVTEVVEPILPDTKIEWVRIEAVHSGATRQIRWKELRDAERWRQGGAAIAAHLRRCRPCAVLDGREGRLRSALRTPPCIWTTLATPRAPSEGYRGGRRGR